MSFSDYLQKRTQQEGITLTPDQREVVQAFEELDCHMRQVKSPLPFFPFSSPKALNWLFTKSFTLSSSHPFPRGLYIWGGVGRGKSMIMDAYQAYATFLNSKRAHFYDFMNGVHTLLQRLREKNKKPSGKTRRGGTNSLLLQEAAKELTSSIDLLCLDEFYVDNIADAMILGPLFEEILKLGKFIITTSNVNPDQLYLKGLNRESFFPFIALLKNQLRVVYTGGLLDHRGENLKKRGNTLPFLYSFPITPQSDSYLIDFFNHISNEEPLQHVPEGLKKGRDGVFINFEDYFSQPTGAKDYETLAAYFKIIILAHIPQFTDERLDKARRFITFIDIIYDRKCRLISNGATSLALIYTGGRLEKEFERTISRLNEMQTWEV
jgi:cell division protein ZapE